MIQLMAPVHPTEGYTVDLVCPVVVCDVCAGVIDADRPGNVLWGPKVGSSQFHVHKGVCDRRIDPGSALSSYELGDWLQRLAHNYATPLVGANVTLNDGEELVIDRLTRLDNTNTQGDQK